MMEIRRATAADAPSIAEVHVRSWQAAYRGVLPRTFLDDLDLAARTTGWERILRASDWPRTGVHVAVVDGDIVGFAHTCATRDSDDDPATVGEITSIYARPESWGTGVGRELMRAARTSLADAGFEQATLWVLDTNERAIRFYEAAGWRRDGAVKNDELGGVAIEEIRYRRPLA